MAPASRTTTDRPASVNLRASVIPVMPPPTTTTSAVRTSLPSEGHSFRRVVARQTERDSIRPHSLQHHKGKRGAHWCWHLSISAATRLACPSGERVSEDLGKSERNP